MIVIASERIEITERCRNDIIKGGYNLINFEFTDYTTVNLLGSVYCSLQGIKFTGEASPLNSKSEGLIKDMEAGASPEKIEEIRNTYVVPLAKSFANTVKMFCELYSLQQGPKKNSFDKGIGVAKHNFRYF